MFTSLRMGRFVVLRVLKERGNVAVELVLDINGGLE
jgi:hypothetical protein